MIVLHMYVYIDKHTYYIYFISLIWPSLFLKNELYLICKCFAYVLYVYIRILRMLYAFFIFDKPILFS